MTLLDTFFLSQLQKRESQHAQRKLTTITDRIDFTSNDYLGLARASVLHDRVLDKIKILNFKSNGATGSRLLSGNAAYTQEVETKLSTLFNSEAALIFNSGYTANLGVLSSIPQKGDTILYDELAHACIKDGARLSLANRFSFRHNDLTDLEQKLKRSTGKIFIAVESVYSMDGDECPLPELTELAEKYGAFIILDEAHSTGIAGKQGAGLAVALGLENKIHIRVYTFGKAIGCHGACVTGSTSLIQYLINFARPFIYTTALPVHSIVTIDCAFDYLRENIHLQNVLHQKIDLFAARLKTIATVPKSKSAIQAIIIPGNDAVRKASHELQQAGFDVRPIISPTVAVNTERLRICLHTYNTDKDIIRLSNLLIQMT